MDAEKLYEVLRQAQEPQGYLFNSDRELVFELLAGLRTNKERYGYMSCPCRLAAGEREQDRDIICPCVYRAPDVEEYGSCYCGLYVSQAWNERELPHVYVPERRPPEKMPF
jgi:ferredoxin-thioredoxin reductase catalytic subunit